MKPFDAGELLAMIKKRLKKQRESMKYCEKKVTAFIETRIRQLELRKKQKKAT